MTVHDLDQLEHFVKRPEAVTEHEDVFLEIMRDQAWTLPNSIDTATELYGKLFEIVNNRNINC